MAVVAGGELMMDMLTCKLALKSYPEKSTPRELDDYDCAWICRSIGNDQSSSIVENNTAKSKGHGYMNESASHVHIHEHSKEKIRISTRSS